MWITRKETGETKAGKAGVDAGVGSADCSVLCGTEWDSQSLGQGPCGFHRSQSPPEQVTQEPPEPSWQPEQVSVSLESKAILQPAVSRTE